MASERVTLTIDAPSGGATDAADASREISLSSPGREIWPAAGVTKRGLAEYALAVAGPFLAHNGGRPISLERFPGAVDGERFFSKNPPRGAPAYVRAVEVTYNSGRKHPQLVLDEAAAIVWAIQMNAVVFHPWASLAGDVDHPVELRLDLDPQPGTDYADAVRVAHLARAVLAEAGLTAFVKTSGGRGIHLFCPIAPAHEFLIVRHAVIAAAREIARRAPDAVSVDWWKEERGARIFVDYNQAARDRTMAGAYSPRATPAATVSTPLGWDELDASDPDAFTVATVPARLAERGDPWARMHETPGAIDTLLAWWERDVADGLGELPFPPDFPKMPGEPPRVQPSRARRRDEG